MSFSRMRKDGGERRGVEGKYVPRVVTSALPVTDQCWTSTRPHPFFNRQIIFFAQAYSENHILLSSVREMACVFTVEKWYNSLSQ